MSGPGHKSFIATQNAPFLLDLAWGTYVNGGLGAPYDLTGYTATFIVWGVRGDDTTQKIFGTIANGQVVINEGAAQNPNIQINIPESSLSVTDKFSGGWYELELTPAAGSSRIILRGQFSLTD